MFQYWNGYLFVLVFLILGIALPIGALYVLGPLLRPNKPNPEKLDTYESGLKPFGDAHVRYNARYYLFALLFVVFDVEVLFLYPWAASSHLLGKFALVEMLLFVLMLVVGLIYAWRKKVLEWT
jgi:NADH-quinone oxidoreductase subunit A